MLKQVLLIGLIAFSVSIDNCKETKKVCKKCGNEFIRVEQKLNNIGCIDKDEYDTAQNESCIGCYNMDLYTSKCNGCERNYAIDDGVCYPIEKCSSPAENKTECASCDMPWCLKDGKCVEEHLCRKMENGKCVECASFYYPNEEGKCIRYPEHCQTMDSEHKKCTECKVYHYLDDDNKCKKITIDYCQKLEQGQCSSCDYRYYVDNDGKTCTRYPGECVKFNNGICQQCKPYYHVTDEGKKCTKNPIDRCTTYSAEEGTCSACENYYTLSDDKKSCVRIEIEHCIYFADGKCISCEDYWHKFPNNDTCTALPEHCRRWYDQDPQYCVLCDDKMYWNTNDKKCITIPVDNCIDYDTTNGCKKCDDNYQLKNGKCNLICETYEEICNVCNDGFDTYDYGKTCTVVDSSVIPVNKSSFIGLNLAIIGFILFML